VSHFRGAPQSSAAAASSGSSIGGALVAEHLELPGRHQLRILPERGPGAIARTARQRHSTPPRHGPAPTLPQVEIRDLALYDALLGDTEIAAPLARVVPGGTTEPGLAGAEGRR